MLAHEVLDPPAGATPRGAFLFLHGILGRGRNWRSIARRFGEERPAWVDALIEDLYQHLGGESRDFAEVPLDLVATTPFQRHVYSVCRELPPGEVTTYAGLAERMGRAASSARAVGSALGKNPVPLVVPCHRVVGSDGRLHGFTAPGGLTLKQRLLDLEA